MTTDATWQAIWARIDDRRTTRGLSWRKLSEIGKVSQKKFAQMRDEGTPLQSEAKRASLSRALGWREDAISRLLDGLEPVEGSTLPVDAGPLSSPDELDGRLRTLHNDHYTMLDTVRDLTRQVTELHRVSEQHAERIARLELAEGEGQAPIAGGG